MGNSVKGVAQTVLFGVEQQSQEAKDVGAKLEDRAEPIYDPVRGKDANELTLAR